MGIGGLSGMLGAKEFATVTTSPARAAMKERTIAASTVLRPRPRVRQPARF